MRIAVNTRLLLPDRLEGIGWFTHETLRRIVRAHPEHQFLFFFDRRFDDRFVYGENVEPVVFGPPTRHPLLYRLWFEYRVPAALARHKADLFLSPDGFLSTRTNIPQIAVMHDLNFEHHPEDLPPAYSRYYRDWFPRFARKAARLVTVSEFSRNDIAARYAIDPHRIHVVYNGVSEVFAPLAPAESSAARERFADGDPYLISVGSINARKNIARLLQAFDAVATERPGLKLVIVGERMFRDGAFEGALRNMRHMERVVFTGRLGQQDLRTALGGALALAFVSYFEGFGIPVAEAMRCGVPVIAARATSLPEVAGDAALYCDPFNVEDIGRAIREVIDDELLRKRLAVAGIERSRHYTWDATAAGLWKVVEQVIHGTT